MIFDKSVYFRGYVIKPILVKEFGINKQSYEVIHALNYYLTLSPHKPIPHSQLFKLLYLGHLAMASSLRLLLQGGFIVMHKIKDVPYFEGRRPKEYRAYKMGKRGFELMIRYTALMQDDSILTGARLKSNCIASPGSTIQPPPPKRTTNERKELLKLLNSSPDPL